MLPGIDDVEATVRPRLGPIEFDATLVRRLRRSRHWHTPFNTGLDGFQFFRILDADRVHDLVTVYGQVQPEPGELIEWTRERGLGPPDFADWPDDIGPPPGWGPEDLRSCGTRTGHRRPRPQASTAGGQRFG